MNWNLTALQTHLESLPGFDLLLSCCADKTSYLVGGTLRDWVLQRPLKDIDLVTPGDPTELARAFGQASGGKWFWLDEARLQSRVVIKQDKLVIFYDFATFRSADLVSDLAARDFTINALAISLSRSPWQWIDPLQGGDDFATKTLRCCSDRAFTEDPLRCLRAVRFYLQLGFSPDVNTLNLIREAVPSLERIAGERIHAELALIFGSPHVHRGIEFFEKLGLTTELFGADLSGPALNRCSAQLKQIGSLIDGRIGANAVVANGFTRLALINLFQLFDATQTTCATQDICDRLRLGRRNTQALMGLRKLSTGKIPSVPPTERGRRLWLEDLPGDRGTSLLFLFCVPSKNALPEPVVLDLLQLLEAFLPEALLPPLVSAMEIQELLGILPGPEVGKVIKQLRLAELQDAIRDRTDAIAFLHGLQEKGD